jgi:hypothetical protein
VARGSQALTTRALTTSESSLVRWLLAHRTPPTAEPAALDLSAALVTRDDESECLRLCGRPRRTEQARLRTCTFDDRDGVSITALLTFDPQGNVRELDLWKADESAIAGLPETFV